MSKRIKLFVVLIGAAGLLLFSPKAQAVSIDTITFPRLANIFLKTPISDQEADSLANWDIVVLGVQATDTDPEIFSVLREKNPDIIIIAYVASAEFPITRLDILESSSGPWHELLAGIDKSWWLMEEGGDHVSFWAGNWSLNPTNLPPKINGERWNTYFPRFLEQEVMARGVWDGIFFDSVWETAAWVNNGNMDLDLDGKKESADEINQEWQEGMEKIFSETRRRLGNEVILIGNGGDGYSDYLNGRMFESFPNQWEDNWTGQIPKYITFMREGQAPQISIINGDTENTGLSNNYQDVRYALTSTLLDNGFFSYDWGTQDHSQLWWYDEFNIALGQPISGPIDLSGNVTEIKEGLWRRDFEKGVVLVNSASSPQSVILETTYEKLLGDQDPVVNTGQLATSISLNGKDGIILLKRLSVIPDTPFINGSLSHVFNYQGQEVRQSFYSYTDQAEGGRLVIVDDLDNDGTNEAILSSGNRIYINDQDGVPRLAFFPYSQFYTGEVTFAVGDVDGDGQKEIVTGTGQGAGPHVRVFSNAGVLEQPGFFAYSQNVRHGVRIGVGDLNNDGKNEIITGPGYGAAPHVRIFEGSTGRVLSGGFFAYDPRIRIGVNIAVGDVDGDNQAEIITGAGPGGGPHIRIFNALAELESPGFFAYSQDERDGVMVAVSDVTGDGIDEIITFKSPYPNL